MKYKIKIFQVLLVLISVGGLYVVITRLKSSLNSRPDNIHVPYQSPKTNNVVALEKSPPVGRVDDCDVEKERIIKNIEEIYANVYEVNVAYSDLRNDNLIWGKYIANWNRNIQSLRTQEHANPLLCSKSSYYENILTHLAQLGIAYANDNLKNIKFHKAKIDENVTLTIKSAEIPWSNTNAKKAIVTIPKYKLFDFSCDNFKCVANVKLNQKPDNYMLQRISNKLRSEKHANGKFHIFYYLPGMDPEDVAWARVDFDPEFNVTFLAGNSLDDQRATERDGKNISGYIGLWEYYRPVEDLILGLRNDSKDGLIMEILKASDPTERSTINVLKKENSKGRIKLVDLDQVRGEYFIIKTNGDLEAYDDKGYIQTQKVIKYSKF